MISDRQLANLSRGFELPDLTGTRYRLIAEIGRGGLGVVYLADDEMLDRRVALKVLRNETDSDGELLKEAKTLARLEHPGIVPVHDAGTLADGRVYYAMKFVEGARLDEYISNPRPLTERMRLFVGIVQAIAFAHSREILHGDLKPANIMVGPFGEVLVMDWGLAFAKGRAGTPGWMPPEAVRDVRSDVYGLGALLRFLAGSEAPKRLAAVAAKAMSADPLSRYSNPVDIAKEVARFLDGQPVEAYPENVLERMGRFLAANKAAVYLVLAYLIMRAALIFLARR